MSLPEVPAVERGRVFHPKGGESRVKQSETGATELGSILQRYLEGNVPVPTERSLYGDFSSGLDFHTALNRVREAEQAFAAVPAHIRSHVQNDPGEFLDMVFDPEDSSSTTSLRPRPKCSERIQRLRTRSKNLGTPRSTHSQL